MRVPMLLLIAASTLAISPAITSYYPIVVALILNVSLGFTAGYAAADIYKNK